jgi:hypothetical protein
VGTGTELAVTCNLPVCNFKLRGCDRLIFQILNSQQNKAYPYARIAGGRALILAYALSFNKLYSASGFVRANARLAATTLVFAVLSLVDVMLLAGMIRHQTAACAHTGADHRALRATD